MNEIESLGSENPSFESATRKITAAAVVVVVEQVEENSKNSLNLKESAADLRRSERGPRDERKSGEPRLTETEM